MERRILKDMPGAVEPKYSQRPEASGSSLKPGLVVAQRLRTAARM
jgi:hypothetical protein